jgi:hypothetical protein
MFSHTKAVGLSIPRAAWGMNFKKRRAAADIYKRRSHIVGKPNISRGDRPAGHGASTWAAEAALSRHRCGVMPVTFRNTVVKCACELKPTDIAI